MGRSAVGAKPRKDSGVGDARKEHFSKDRKENHLCYLQRASPGGIMLLELVFQVRFDFGTITKSQLYVRCFLFADYFFSVPLLGSAKKI